MKCQLCHNEIKEKEETRRIRSLYDLRRKTIVHKKCYIDLGVKQIGGLVDALNKTFNSK